MRGGRSLVLELPLPWCLSSTRSSAGSLWDCWAHSVVDILASAARRRLEPLSALAAALLDQGLDADSWQSWKAGVSYAAARQPPWRKRRGIGGVSETPKQHYAVDI
jgi:hypothetical protein